ncbi:MAG TPA: polysaccharide biosynthesis/export family protein [Myxococcales bacterium]|jgi:polysaccharide export outer membrane protein
MLASRSVLLVAASAAALLASACRTPGRDVPSYSTRDQMAHSAPVANSSLGVGDVLEVRVYQEPDLSGAFRVATEGSIDYPFCGRIKVAGLSSSALVDLLTACLKNGFLKRPQVTVFLKEYNSQKVFVFGEVQKPGTFAFEPSMTIIQAITLANGFTKLAAKDSVIVTRVVVDEKTLQSDERKVKVPVESIGEGREKNFFVQPGDIVYVPESFL